jgi:hypothetical protein
MFPLSKLLFLLVTSSDGIPVVALPAPTRVASSAARLVYHHRKHDIAGQTRSSFSAFCHSIFMQAGTRQGTTSFDSDRQHGPASTGEQAATPFRPSLLDIDCIVRLYQSIRGPTTRSRQPEQSEHQQQQQQTTDPAPYDMLTGILGPTDDASGTVDATKSTIASGQMNATVTLNATASAENIPRGTLPSFVVAATPGPSSQNGLWSTFSKFAAEPTSTVTIASSRMDAAVTPDATTSAETITPGSSSSFVIATTPAPNSLNGL